MIGRAIAGIAGYFRARMAGSVPLSIVFWRDMIAIGSSLMLVSLGLILVLAMNNAPTWAIVVAYLLNWPYSLFIVLAVWKAAASSAPATRFMAQTVALLWLVFSLVI